MRIGFVLRWSIYLATGVLLAVAAQSAQADVNLAQLCSATQTGSATCTGVTTWDYPGSNKLVRPSAGWYFWGTVADTSPISVCTVDIARGSTSCPTSGVLPKGLVATTPPASAHPVTPPAGSTFAIRITWNPVTTGTEGTTPVSLASGDLVGYQVSWTPQAGGRGAEIPLSPTTTSYLLVVPIQAVCVSLMAQGRESWSDASQPICIAPRPKDPLKPDVPANVTVTFGEP